MEGLNFTVNRVQAHYTNTASFFNQIRLPSMKSYSPETNKSNRFLFHNAWKSVVVKRMERSKINSWKGERQNAQNPNNAGPTD